MHKVDLIYLVKEQFDRVFLSIHQDEYGPYKSYFLADGIYNVFLLWLINDYKETPEELADRMNDMLVK
ncbi:MAG: TetR family transcriptional regulator C-terminal domain-containing protein [Clostridia bacterium]|nr:TetR family transcriptional regulator C-terminal domain-containing protein [Clostridia bacterium]